MITSPLQIHSSNRLFTRDGLVHRIKSVTAFKLLYRYSQGEDINPFLESYPRSNELIILSSTDGPNTPWGNDAWPLPSKTMVKEFCEYVGERNWDVEFVLITGNQDEKISSLKEIVNYLATKKLKNLTFEAVNEPQFNKSNPELLRDTLEQSGYLYSSGIYHDNNKFFGKYVDYHPARDSEWVRKFHDGLEYWQGGGPNYPEEKGLKVPSKANEPIRPDQTGFNQLDFYTFGAGLGLFGSGGCFHSQSGKLANLPSQQELDCYNSFMTGMELFPADACLGSYSRPVENSLRTYIVGEHMIRVRPTSPNPPLDGFTSLDSFHICYSTSSIQFPADPPPSVHKDDMPKYTYEQMMDLTEKMRAAYRSGSLGRTQPDMPTTTEAHLLWRYFFEGYTEEQLIEDARLRGMGIVPP